MNVIEEIVRVIGPRVYDVELEAEGEEEDWGVDEDEDDKHTTFSREEKVDGLREKLQRYAGLDVSDIWNDDEDDDKVIVEEVPSVNEVVVKTPR